MGLDLNRGCTIRLHPQGFRVAMYKSDPGVYYDSSGNPLSDAIAKQAGFDTERMAKEALKAKRFAEARAKIEQEFAEKEAAAAELMNAEGGAFEVRHVGAGKYAIFDEAGNRVTKKAMGEEEAKKLLDDFNLPKKQEPKAETETKENTDGS